MRLIDPDWPRHPRVRACVTTRHGGASPSPYDSLNLAAHVGDDPANIAENRRRLRSAAGLRREPAWLDQVHGTRVVRIDGDELHDAGADAAWTDRLETPCVVMSADCLPVLFAADDGSCIAAAHAGWRGLAAGVLEQTLWALPVAPSVLSAWMGPAIGPTAYEVGAEVRAAFERTMSLPTAAFTPKPSGRWWCDLYEIARARLAAAGVTRVYGGNRCTLSESSEFFSHRRDGTCGRIASLVWLS
jgi:YfiH family protein